MLCMRTYSCTYIFEHIYAFDLETHKFFANAVEQFSLQPALCKHFYCYMFLLIVTIFDNVGFLDGIFRFFPVLSNPQLCFTLSFTIKSFFFYISFSLNCLVLLKKIFIIERLQMSPFFSIDPAPIAHCSTSW